MRKTIIKKILSIVTITVLVLEPVVFPVLTRAEEGTATSSAETTQATTVSEPSPTPTEQPASDQATTTTGDAASTSTTDTTVNTHQDELPGQVTSTEGCTPVEGQTSCPQSIENQNVAQTDVEATSSASTGTNRIDNTDGSAAITTGDATASGQISTEANSNTVELIPTDTPTQDAGQSSQPDSQSSLEISTTNEATASATESVTASTGGNSAQGNAGDVQIQTGNALAYANLFNLINTNIVGTDFVILVLNLDSQNGDIDLNQVWKEILERSQSPDLQILPETIGNLTIQVINQAEVENNVDVTASSGSNNASYNRKAMIVTGDAIALANVVNIINTNFSGTAFFFGAINILNNFTGNLILPRPEMFTSQNSGQTTSTESPQISNSAQTSDQVKTIASTGENSAQGNSQGSAVSTGDAQSVANSFSVVNLTVTKNGWFLLVLNNLGSWVGYILGWDSPSSSQAATSGTTVLATEGDAPDGTSQGEESNTNISLDNQASVKNNINVSALTGGNLANGNQFATIYTGKARSLANLFNLVNLNILGSFWFMGLVNVLGDWQGNAIFAYPDTTVQISGPAGDIKPGDELSYHLNFQNQGYDDAQDVKIRFPLPSGLTYLSNSFGPTVQVGESLEWSIGNLKPQQEGSIEVRLKVSPDLIPSDLLTFWDKLITPALAAEDGQRENLVVNVLISTSDPQSDISNDSSSTTTNIYFPSATSDPAANNGDGTIEMTTLELSAKNNVNQFVYPGDTVTFEIRVKNTGSVGAKNIILSQKMYDGAPEDLGSADIPIGDLEPGQSVKVSFGLKLAEDLPSSIYTTKARATGDNTTSNEAVTQFRVKGSVIGASVPEALATDGTTSDNPLTDVLGAQDEARIKPKTEWLPYVLVTLLGLLWLTEFYRRKTLQGRLEQLSKKNKSQTTLSSPT